jgi:hypothetical protein
MEMPVKSPSEPARPDSGVAIPSWQRGARHPVSVMALLLLVLNDHLLKGAGLLPGWLTGKLSDFAGLVVATVLLATVLRLRSGRSRVVACAVVGLGFAAVKLSPGAARALEQSLALVHLDWRLWCDPTDLVALVVLPLAWWLAGGPAGRARPSVGKRERLLVIAGALACAATSRVEPHAVELSLVNRTRGSIPIARFVARGALDCAAIATGDHPLTGVSFVSDGCLLLAPGARTTIGEITVDEEDLPDAEATDAGAPPCTLLGIRAPGLQDSVLLWQAKARGQGSTEAAPSDVYIEEVGDRRFVAGTDHVQVWTAASQLPQSTCPGVP